jgi:hypothetical protein
MVTPPALRPARRACPPLASRAQASTWMRGPDGPPEWGIIAPNGPEGPAWRGGTAASPRGQLAGPGPTQQGHHDARTSSNAMAARWCTRSSWPRGGPTVRPTDGSRLRACRRLVGPSDHRECEVAVTEWRDHQPAPQVGASVWAWQGGQSATRWSRSRGPRPRGAALRDPDGSSRASSSRRSSAKPGTSPIRHRSTSTTSGAYCSPTRSRCRTRRNRPTPRG